MGATVKIQRVNEFLLPIKKTVCWVEFKESRFDDRQLDELIQGLRRIGIRDCRVTLGQTTLNDAQRKRLMDKAASPLSYRFDPSKLPPDRGVK